MGTKALNLQSNESIEQWLKQNDISLHNRDEREHDSTVSKSRFPSELQPKSNESMTDTKEQTLHQPSYSQSHFRNASSSQSEASFSTFANQTELSQSFASELHLHKQSHDLKNGRRPSMKRMSYSTHHHEESTKVQSLQLVPVTPRSITHTPSRSRAINGSLVQSSRRHKRNKASAIETK